MLVFFCQFFNSMSITTAQSKKISINIQRYRSKTCHYRFIVATIILLNGCSILHRELGFVDLSRLFLQQGV